MIDLVWAAIFFVLRLLAPPLGGWASNRFGPAPIRFEFYECGHYGPESGATGVATTDFFEKVRKRGSLDGVNTGRHVTFLTATPFVIRAVNLSEQNNPRMVHIREVWLSLVRFTPLSVVAVEAPTAVNIRFVQASGRGSDCRLGGKICTTKMIQIPLLLQAAKADGKGTHRIRIEPGHDFEIELLVVAETPGRYEFELAVEYEWGRRTARQVVAKNWRLLETQHLGWTRQSIVTFPGADVAFENHQGLDVPSDWLTYRRELDCACNDRKFVSLPAG